MIKRILMLMLCLALLGGCTVLAEEAAEAMETPEPIPAPTVEVLAERYFESLADLEIGTAGASLKTAEAAERVCAFAAEYALYNPEVDALRANLLEALEAMDDARQEAFWQGFCAVRALLDDCLDDWEANRPLFEDAGAAEAMDEVMYDPLNRLSWQNLRDHTLTLGNEPVA